MKIKTYHIEFNSFREGKNYSLEQTVEAVDIYDAMEIVEKVLRYLDNDSERNTLKKILNMEI